MLASLILVNCKPADSFIPPVDAAGEPFAYLSGEFNDETGTDYLWLEMPELEERIEPNMTGGMKRLVCVNACDAFIRFQDGRSAIPIRNVSRMASLAATQDWNGDNVDEIILILHENFADEYILMDITTGLPIAPYAVINRREHGGTVTASNVFQKDAGKIQYLRSEVGEGGWILKQVVVDPKTFDAAAYAKRRVRAERTGYDGQ